MTLATLFPTRFPRDDNTKARGQGRGQESGYTLHSREHS